MAINQPHEGGLFMLGRTFGTQATNTITVNYYVDNPPVGEYENGAWVDANADGASLLNFATYTSAITSDTWRAGHTANATLDAAISLVQGVPQIELPEVVVNYGADVSTLTADAGTNVYGYAIVIDNEEVTVFRELFDTPFPIAANGTMRFFPVLRLGNTSCKLT